MRSQLSDAEARVKAKGEEASKHKGAFDKVQGELEKSKTALKDEEEKGSKAISLLKTVRTKLVKAEKERDDAIKEANASKDKVRDEVERERQEKVRLEQELERLRGDKDREIVALKGQIDKEINNLKEKHDLDLATRKSQHELEIITIKVRVCQGYSQSNLLNFSLHSTIGESY